jgi:type I restriction enzyme S subunit
MSSYTISKKLNPNKVFILQKSELEKRFDPQYYQKEYKNIVNKLKENKHSKLGEIVKFSKETWNQKDFFNDTFPYIEISEIDTLSGEIQNISNIELSNAASRAKMIVRENDIIVSTTRPNRGAIALINKEQDFSIASTGFCVIRDSAIDKNYLFAILKQNFILKQFEQRSSGGNYPAITQEELSSVIIPIAENDKQIKIKTIFQECFKQKKINEEKAENLLNSIDTYLLNQLGIVLPKKQENTLKSRMFTASISELSGTRFDPYFNQAKFKQLDDCLQKGCFSISNLKKQSILITSGATPLSKGDSYTLDKTVGIPFIRSGEISNINFDDCIYIKPEIHNSMLKSSQLKKGDLLIAIVGATIGEIGIYNFIREGNINQAIALVRLKDSLLPSFAMEFFKSSIGKFILDKAKRPVARANINLDEIGTLPIIVPPFSKQLEIAEHISAIRKQAQDLKDQTKLLLEKANKEIEDILLNT